MLGTAVIDLAVGSSSPALLSVPATTSLVLAGLAVERGAPGILTFYRPVRIPTTTVSRVVARSRAVREDEVLKYAASQDIDGGPAVSDVVVEGRTLDD